jgi:glycerol kinase
MSRVSGVLAIDQGTTGSMAMVVAEDGRVVGQSYSEFTQHFPVPGWVEHDAEEIWEVTRRVSREALESAGPQLQVEAVGITNQRETLVLWDRETLAPVHRAIVWQDRRTASICSELRSGGHEQEVRARTGLLLDPYFSGTKLTWLFREKPELRRRAESGELAAGTIDSWLVARLTGGQSHVTEHTNASRTLLYNLRTQGWDPRLLDLLEVPEGILPEVRRSSGEMGMCMGDALGLEVPVAGVAGDQQAALFGQGCWKPGMAKNTFGTGAFLLLHTGDTPIASESGLLTTMACDERGGPAYALEGSIFIAGAALQWLRDGLGILDSAEESEALARGLTSNEGVHFVPAFVGLGAPHWDPDARGTITGLTRGSTRAHLARAALEAMAFGTEEVIRAMESDSGVETQELRVDGGAAKNDWLMEFQADILGVPVRRPGLVETTALGAAGLAGLGTGVWEGAGDFLGALGEATSFSPSMSSDDRGAALEGWRRAVGTARAWSGWEGDAQ